MACASHDGFFIRLNFPKPMIFAGRILVEILNPGICPDRSWQMVEQGARGEIVGAGQDGGGGGDNPREPWVFYAVYQQIFPPMWRFVCRGSFVGPHFPQKLTFSWFYGKTSG